MTSRPANATVSQRNLRQTKRVRNFVDLTPRQGFGPPVLFKPDTAR